MSPEQSRAARGWLDWSQTELARRANISLTTVRNFEGGVRKPIPLTLAAMRRALEEGGVMIINAPDGNALGIARNATFDHHATGSFKCLISSTS